MGVCQSINIKSKTDTTPIYQFEIAIKLVFQLEIAQELSPGLLTEL